MGKILDKEGECFYVERILEVLQPKIFAQVKIEMKSSVALENYLKNLRSCHLIEMVYKYLSA